MGRRRRTVLWKKFRRAANISKTVDWRKKFLFPNWISVPRYVSNMPFLGPRYHLGIPIAPESEMRRVEPTEKNKNRWAANISKTVDFRKNFVFFKVFSIKKIIQSAKIVLGRWNGPCSQMPTKYHKLAAFSKTLFYQFPVITNSDASQIHLYLVNTDAS